jgi:PAS domain S-box-containing protein
VAADHSLEGVTKLLATSPDPAFVVDRDGRIVYWNRAADAFFGVPADEALGRPCATVVRGLGDAGEIHCTRACPLLARASRDDSYEVAEMQVPIKPRPVGWKRVSVHHVPLEDDGGKLGYVLHVITDSPAGRPRPARSS